MDILDTLLVFKNCSIGGKRSPPICSQIQEIFLSFLPLLKLATEYIKSLKKILWAAILIGSPSIQLIFIECMPCTTKLYKNMWWQRKPAIKN